MNHRTTRLTVATESHCTKKTEVKPRNIQTEKSKEDSDCGATDRSGLSESLYMDRNSGNVPSDTLRKNAYSNILRILPPKNENFQMKNSVRVHISGQKTDCGYSFKPPRRGGSNEYPQSMFFSRNKKNNEHPCKPQFYCIKVGFKGVRSI